MKLLQEEKTQAELEAFLKRPLGAVVVDVAQTAFDLVSLLPVVGTPFALASGAISLYKGDVIGASLSLLAALPGGAAAKASAQAAAKAAKRLEHAAETVYEASGAVKYLDLAKQAGQATEARFAEAIRQAETNLAAALETGVLTRDKAKDILKGMKVEEATAEQVLARAEAMAAKEGKVAGYATSKKYFLEMVEGPKCFAAGTPLLTPEGARPVEELRPGDQVLSRSEHDPDGPVAAKPVEAVFVRVALVRSLRVKGREIPTTGEHPFYVCGKGWVKAAFLAVGDLLLGHEGQWTPLEAAADTGAIETVYNLGVADYHTYFVGCQEWGFNVWAHNAACDFMEAINKLLPEGQKLNQKQAETLWGTLTNGVAQDDLATIVSRLQSQSGGRGKLAQGLGRNLSREEATALARAGAKGNPLFDPVARQLLERSVGGSAAARAEIERTFAHSSQSGRTVTVEKTGNKVYVEGQVQSGTSAGHQERMVQVAANALEGEGTVAVFVDRPLAEALTWLEKQPGITASERAALQRAQASLKVSIPENASKEILRTSPVKDPDVVCFRNVGTVEKPQYKIDITEVFSPPGQTREELADRLGKAFDLLPSSMRGRKLPLPPVKGD
jgi:hypothetical protein